MAIRKDNLLNRQAFWVQVAFYAGLVWMIPNTWAYAQSFVIRGVRVFNGRDLITGADVLVEGGKIKAVGKQLAAAGDAQVVDGTGDTLLPGLVDDHTNTFGEA